MTHFPKTDASGITYHLESRDPDETQWAYVSVVLAGDYREAQRKAQHIIADQGQFLTEPRVYRLVIPISTTEFDPTPKLNWETAS